MSRPADYLERDNALRLDRHVVAVAPAGSGKTGLLVRRALRALASVDEPEAVVCITFTNKAAAEIRHRISTALADAEGPAPDDPFDAAVHADAAAALAQDRARGWNLRAHPGRLQALTIDAFNQWLTARMPVLSGLGGRAAITTDSQALYADAVLAVFDPASEGDLAADDRDAIATVLAWADNRLDQLLPVLTDLLDRRDQWLDHRGALRAADGARDRAILAGWIEGRLNQVRRHLDIALTDAQLDAMRAAVTHASAHWPGARPPAIDDWPASDADHLDAWRHVAAVLLTADGNWRRRVDKNCGFPTTDRDAKHAVTTLLAELADDAPDLADALHAIRQLPDPDLPADMLALRAALGRVLDLCYAALRVTFAQRGETDFTEVALAAVTAASGEAGSDAIARAEARIAHLLVDEMQDTSESQVRLIEELTANWQPGDGRSLFLVGDPQQSIYAFRKAEVRLFLNILQRRQLGSLTLHCEPLTANFRSAPALIDWFNTALPQLFPDTPDADIGAVAYTPCTAARPEQPGAGVRIVPVATDDAAAETAAAVAAVQTVLADAAADARVAVLAATRGQLAPVLDGLRMAGVAVQAVDVDPLTARPAVADVVHLIRALMHPHDALAWTVLLRAPFVGLQWADLVALSRGRTQQTWRQRLADADHDTLSADGQARLQRLLQALAVADGLRAELPTAARTLWHLLDGPGCCDATTLRAVQQLLVCLDAHCRGGQLADWPGFLRALDRLYHPPGSGRVEASTIHKSKGLQYDHVIVVGTGQRRRAESRPLLHLRTLGDDVMLIPRPADDQAPGQAHYDALHALQVAAVDAETARLIYVAVTRARTSLTLVAGAGGLTDDAGETRFSPRKRSLADFLWPVLAPAFADLTPDEDPADGDEHPPVLPAVPRLAADHQTPQAPAAWQPPARRTLKPSEAALADDGAPGADADNEATLIGSLYHQAMERIVADGLDAWADAGRSRLPAMHAGLRRMGMPDTRVEPAAQRVIQLLDTTLASDAGRWLLGAHPWHACEYHLTGWMEGRWVTAIIDRCLTDDHGDLWVVDYKTTNNAITDADRYREQARAHYAGQLGHYARLLGELRDAERVRSALFLAELGELVVLDD